MEVAEYVCGCGCMYTNSDMFYDYLQGREPTRKELIQFGEAKAVFRYESERRQKVHTRQDRASKVSEDRRVRCQTP